LANNKVTIEFGGDIKRLKSAVDEGVKQLSRLEAAQKKLMGGKVSTAEFTQFNTLNKQQLAEVQRIAREREKFAQATALQEQRLAAQTSQVRERLDRQSAQSAQKIDLEKQKVVAQTAAVQQKINQQSAQFEIKTGLEKQRAAEKTELAKQRAAQQTAIQRERLAQQSAQFEIRNAQAVARAEDAARRRQVADFARAERDKNRIAQAETRNRFSFSKLGGKLNSAGQGIRNAGQTAAIGITAPIAAAAYSIISAGAEYEKALNTFQAVTKATNDEMAAAANTAKRLGADITLPATSAKDAALAMTELGKAGLSANQAMAASKGVLQLAAAGQIDEARAAEIAANALNSFKLQAIDTVRVADLLAAASNASSAEVGDIAEAMQQASAIFAGAKIPIEDLTSAISIMANAGIKGSDAGTSLKTFIQRLQSPTDNAADAMKNLGVQVFDAQGKMKALPDIIGQFDKALTGLTDEQKAQALNNIFGADAIRAAQILFTEGEAGFNKMKGAVTEVGAAAELAAAKTKGLGGAWDAFKSQLETIGIDAYENIKTPLTDAVQLATQVVAQIGGAFSQLPPTVQTGIVVFTALVAAIAPVLIAVGAVAAGISGLIAAFGAISGAVAAAGGIAALAPIILGVVAVIGVLAVAAVALYEAWANNFGNIQGVVSVFIGMVSASFNSLLSIVQPAVDAVSSYVTEGFNQISEWWATNGAAINEAATTVYATLLTIVREALDAIKDFWASNGAWITSYTTEIWNAVKVTIGGALEVIGGLIKVAAAVINGDWSAVWSGLNSIVNGALHAVAGVIAAGLILVVGAVRAGLAGIWALAGFILQQAYDLGAAVVTGIINGIKAGVGAIASAAWDLGKRAINAIGEAVDSHSPSREAHKIGAFVGDGLANGIESKTERVKKAAKKLGDETIKQLREAVKEFEKLAGASPQQVGRIQQADTIKNATGNQSEIIKLRGELGVNQYRNLPTTVSGTDRELKDLQAKKAAQDDFNKSLEELAGIRQEVQQLEAESQKSLEDKIKSIKESGALELLKLQEEIDLTGVAGQKERERITNLYEIKNLREQMYNDGYGQQAIDDAAQVLRLEQGRRQELEYILNIRKQVAGATDLGTGLTDKLSGLQNGNREISEYEKTLSKINTDYKDISPAQRESLLNTAKQVDAQKAYNEQYKQTYDFIRGSFDILTEKGKSFGDKMKSIFGGIADKFKKMLLDMASQWLTNKVMGGSSSSGGGGIGGIIKNFLGGGQSSGSSSGGGVGGIIQSFLGGGSSGGGGITFGLGGTGSTGTRPRIAGQSGSQSPLSGLFSAEGISSAIASGGITAAIMLAQVALSTHSPLVGAATGGVIGFLSATLRRNARRKSEEKQRTQFLQDGINGLSGFDTIIQAVRSLHLDPASGLLQGKTLGDSLHASYIQQANTLKDKKTRNIALKSVSELDFRIREKMDLLEAVAKKSASVKDLEGHIVGEFARGNYFGGGRDDQTRDMRRNLDMRRGYINGGQLGVDRHLGLFADGEIIANLDHQRRIIEAAGFDVFASAGIPNYPGKPQPVKGYAEGNYFGTSAITPIAAPNSSSVIVKDERPINVTVNVEQDSFGRWKAHAESDSGQKVTTNVVEKKYANSELRLQKR